MTAQLIHPIQARWPASDPSKLQLYSFPTPNGVKISIMLEETGLPYEAHLVTLADADVKSPAFLSLNPNNKIPAILDPNGPDGAPLALFESGAILIYLAEKTGMLLPDDPAKRYEVIQWVMFQMGGLGPMLGQLGYFYAFAGKEIEDPRPRERYIGEAKRLLAVLETQLQDRDWIAGDYSIADIAIAPWLRALAFYKAEEVLGWDAHERLKDYVARFAARDAVQKGINIPPRPTS
ncbi:MAG: glutathione S-transferase N-terminal domain-containing protein [Paracoccaceae bacterium]